MEKSMGGGTAPLNYIYLLKNNYLRYSRYTKDTDHSEEAAYSRIVEAYNAEKGKAMALAYSKNPLMKNKKASDEYCKKLEATVGYFVEDSKTKRPDGKSYKDAVKEKVEKDIKWGIESVDIIIGGEDGKTVSVKNNGTKISNQNKQMMFNKKTAYNNILKRIDEIEGRLTDALQNGKTSLNNQSIDHWMKTTKQLKTKIEETKAELEKMGVSVSDNIKRDDFYREIRGNLENNSKYIRELNSLMSDLNELIKAEWSVPPEGYYSGKLLEYILEILPEFALNASEELVSDEVKKIFSGISKVDLTANETGTIQDFYTKAKKGGINFAGTGYSTKILDHVTYEYSSASKADIVYEYEQVNLADETFKNFKAGISAKNVSSEKGDFKVVDDANMISFFMQMSGATNFNWQWANFFGVHSGVSAAQLGERKDAFSKYKKSLRLMFMSLSMYYALSGDIDNKANPANYMVIWRGKYPKAYSIGQIYKKIIDEQTTISATGEASGSLYTLKYRGGFGGNDKSFKNFDFNEVADPDDYVQNDTKAMRYKKGIDRTNNIYDEIKRTKLTALINQRILTKIDGGL